MTDPKREAALLLCQEARKDMGAVYAGFCTRDPDLTLELAHEKLQKARDELRDFQLGLSYQVALNQLMPGWVDIDASEYLPKKLWFAHLDTTKEGWVAWLVEHGVDANTAVTLVNEQWPQERS